MSERPDHRSQAASDGAHGSRRDGDVWVAGCGPAGALVAAILAGWGRRVTLVGRAPARRPVPEETVVPGASELFERLGLGHLLTRPPHAVGRGGNGGNGSAPRRHGMIWGTDQVRWRPATSAGEAAPDFQVERAHLDRALVELARERGATIVDGLARRTTVDTRSPFVVATGKSAGSLARRDVVLELAPTIALSARIDVRAPAGDAAASELLAATLIEAVAEGWLWWLPLHAGGVCLTLFADRDELHERGKLELWRSALAGAHGPARDYVDIPPTGGMDATARLFQSAEAFLVGDAAGTVDPLSSQGLQKALASAEHVAYAVNTTLAHPELADEMLAACIAWERRLFGAHGGSARAYYALETRFPDAPFWRRRRVDLPVDENATRATLTLPHRLERNPDVVAASVWRRERRQLVAAPAFRLGPGEPLDRIGTVPLAPLFASLRRPRTVAELVTDARQHAELATLTPRAVTRVLAQMLTLGLVRSAD